VAFLIGAIVGVLAGWFLARATATAPVRDDGEPVVPRSLGAAVTDFFKIAGLLVVVGIVLLILATDIAHHHS
jgi:hypothetical protein